MKVLRYTGVLASTLKAKTKPEPWLHCVLFNDEEAALTANVKNSMIAIVYVWDTRDVIEVIKQKPELYRNLRGRYAADNGLSLNGGGSMVNKLNSFFKDSEDNKDSVTLYHVSKHEFESFEPNILTFFFKDRRESNALAENFEDEGFPAFKYKVELPNEIFSKIKSAPSDIEEELVENPTKAEMKSGKLGDYLRTLAKERVPGVKISDYSQIDSSNDADSYALFYPIVKNLKLIKL